MTLPARAAWRDDAACLPYPTEWWFPARNGMGSTTTDTQAALNICATCPAIVQCREHGLSLPVNDPGIYGGLTGRMRRRERRAKWSNARTAATHKPVVLFVDSVGRCTFCGRAGKHVANCPSPDNQ